jgi:hypothetical protein
MSIPVSVSTEIQNFVSKLVKNINDGMSLKQYFDDDRDSIQFIFSINNFPRQFQCKLCYCCGDYIRCETEKAPKCNNKEHLDITLSHEKKMNQKLNIKNIEYWLNFAKTGKEEGDYERGMSMVRYLSSKH